MSLEKKPVTRKDVAKYAGVSETIVSYVLNNNRYVASEKREKVLDAVAKLNYHPNSVAQMLKGKKSNHLIFIADNISSEHFGKLVEEIDKYAYDKSYLVSLIAHRNDDDFVARIMSRPVDGIIISSATFETKYVKKLIATGIPVILLVSRKYDDIENASKIQTGIKQATKDAVSLLAKKGRKNIIYIDRVSQNNRFSDKNDFRYNGFCSQMEKCGLENNEQNFISGYKNEQELFDGLKQKIQNGLKVDGVVGRNDTMASIAMSAILSCGLKVPEDVSVIGFDNARLSNYISPKLTSMEMDREKIAKAIITMMEERIAGGKPTTQSFGAKLILRESL